LYAENPATGFLPSTGPLDRLELPDTVRVETGVEEGGEVSPFYDPMIAKLVVHAGTRDAAIGRLGAACTKVECSPVRTNAWFLARLLAEPAFKRGDVTTGFVGDHSATLAEAPIPSPELLQIAADAIAMSPPFVTDARGSVPFLMAHGLRGFRLNALDRADVRVTVDGMPQTVSLEMSPDALLDAGWDRPTVLVDDDGEITAYEDGAAFVIALARVSGSAPGAAADGAILSPMPGRIIAVDVALGDAVVKGQKLVTLEAMKMEHGLVAPFDGVVEALAAVVGGQVSEGAVLVTIVSAQ
jgi:3-methylcrotonyl-CoA carboxylase alpha subunit